MKDYSLLTFEKNKLLLKNWTKTFLTELNNKVFSLYNYNNFFIPDFLKRSSINTYKDLEYHHWYRVSEEDVSLTPEEQRIINETAEEQHWTDAQKQEAIDAILIPRRAKFLNSKAGYAIISYARNENQNIENQNGLIRSDSKYYVTVPSAWGGFYDFYVVEDTWYFTFDQYAEEVLGKNNLKYNINNFASRFFIKNINTAELITGTNGQTVQAALNNQDDYIIDIGNNRWTDIHGNPVMGFTFYNNEEIVLDTTISYSRVEKSNIARYTIIRKSNNVEVAPSNTYIVVI